VGGRWRDTGTKCERALVEQFTGGAWHAVPIPQRGACTSSNPSALFGVTFAGTSVYAVGQADISTLAEQRVSGHWRIVKSGN
jgi:hypothetical protein